MKVVYNWLKDFVDVTATPDDLASRLALSGTNIGGVEKGAHGAVIDAEVSSNRPDSLSHYGIAREISAVYKLPLKAVPQPKLAESSSAKASDAVQVDIQSPELCGRFTARVIRGVKIAPSPAWLRERLEASGVASISNVVDATNYVMLELGQPTHAYDYDKIRDHRIVVRTCARRRKDAHARRRRANDRCRDLHDRRRRWLACESASAESWVAPTPKFRFRRKTF